MAHSTTTTTTTTTTASPSRTTRERLVGAVQVAAFTALWIGLGLVLDLDPRVYLVTGVPLVVAFELWVQTAAAARPLGPRRRAVPAGPAGETSRPCAARLPA